MDDLPLKVELEQIDNVALIKLAANFYTSNDMAKKLKLVLIQLFDSQDLFIVVNMDEVTSIDSEGLGALSYGYKHCISNGGNLVLCELNNRDVAEVLEIVNLDKIIPIYKTQQEALEKIKEDIDDL